MIDTGNITAWIQAVSFNNGARWVEKNEKIQIHLFAGQNIYYKIPLGATDWYYLFVNRDARADARALIRETSKFYVGIQRFREQGTIFYMPFVFFCRV